MCNSHVLTNTARVHKLENMSIKSNYLTITSNKPWNPCCVFQCKQGACKPGKRINISILPPGFILLQSMNWLLIPLASLELHTCLHISNLPLPPRDDKIPCLASSAMWQRQINCKACTASQGERGAPSISIFIFPMSGLSAGETFCAANGK